ncbi:hypothetical protein ACH4UT_28595 [Streptomyces sp. NPDC020799]|uniref:hypothetical protein n=1 Tax=Streptomyces sp. NPDC020799 TaxID=3365091 RepID=UPI0037BDBEB3
MRRVLRPLATTALLAPLIIGLAAPAHADAATAVNDITQKIGPQITQLTNDLNDFPASGLNGTLTNDVGNLIGAVGSTAGDALSSGNGG